MPKLYRSIFTAVLLAALCSSFAVAQNDPGGLESDFAPLQLPELDLPDLQPPDLVLPQLDAPLVMPQLDAPLVMPRPQNQEFIPLPQFEPEVPTTVLEVPRVTIDEPAPGELVLPELTMPTPENSTADFGQNRSVLRPQIAPGEELQLLPLDNREPAQARRPQMTTPRALPYGNSGLGNSAAYGNNAAASRLGRLLSVPVQVEVFTERRGYVPYGGYRSFNFEYRPSNYRPSYPRGYRSGGYAPYGGRDCPSRR